MSITASAPTTTSIDRNHLAGPHDDDVARLARARPAPPQAGRRRRSCATFGARWINAVSSRRARREATASSDAPPENISPITTPASSCPSASEPTMATSAIVSTPRLCSITTLRITSTASSVASSDDRRHATRRGRPPHRRRAMQHEPAHDRNQSDRRQQLRAMFDQPLQPLPEHGTAARSATLPAGLSRRRGGRSKRRLHDLDDTSRPARPSSAESTRARLTPMHDAVAASLRTGNYRSSARIHG